MKESSHSTLRIIDPFNICQTPTPQVQINKEVIFGDTGIPNSTGGRFSPLME